MDHNVVEFNDHRSTKHKDILKPKLIEETKQTLIEARKLIEKPENWCKGALVKHYETHSAYCALGALEKVASYARASARNALINSLPRKLWIGPKRRSVVEFNNHPDTTHRQVLKLFDRAIKSL